jgi:hypothetical protein
MAKIDIDKLLKPVSDGNPCGPEKDDDMTLYADWSVIEKHAQGQAEDQFGRGKEPDWKSVFSGSQELLGKIRMPRWLLICWLPQQNYTACRGLARAFSPLSNLWRSIGRCYSRGC